MVNDTISDMLTRIRNANLIKSKSVLIPLTHLSQQISIVLEKEGFIDSFLITSSNELQIKLKYKGLYKTPCITNLKRISKPGLRIYINYKEIPKILGGMGILILSTSKGIMTGREARFHKIGGEIICTIW
uniref:Small ribosomal subunit protein uS8c n=1 Tax=Koliella corcontica TaxID=155904 RepID=A0A097KMX2_9CHLO|nr:ribosomal protein S8 [Koliella corcontica]AIT94528.1 ribosomal protein S8 [Koliella corcontica]